MTPADNVEQAGSDLVERICWDETCLAYIIRTNFLPDKITFLTPPDYIAWRYAIEGIGAAYSDLRYHRRTVAGLLARSGRSVLCALYHRLWSCLYRNGEPRWIRHLASATWHRSVVRQRWRQAFSPALRRHTRRDDYL